VKPFLNSAADQFLHAGGTFLSIAACALFFNAEITMPAGAFIGLSYGLIRELTEYHCAKAELDRFFELWLRMPFTDPRAFEAMADARTEIPISSPFSKGSLIDQFFWTLGGALGGLTF
jgi:hypothetical protein